LFVSRILGLSGYDAGPSWSISTLANVDGSTIVSEGYDGSAFSFTGTTGGTVTYSDFSGLSFYENVNNQFTLSDGTTSTIQAQLNSFITSVVKSNSLSATSAYVFGTIDETQYTSFFSTRNNTNVYGVANLSLSADTLSSRSNDAWYYSQFIPTGSTGGYSGFSFGVYIYEMGQSSPGVYTGSTRVKSTYYAGTAYTEYNDVVIATLRSRGVSNYTSTTNPLYQVTGTTDVVLDFNGAYSGASMSPYSPFGVSGITYDGNTFEFKASLDSTDTNFISKVFGQSNFGKPSNEVPLFVEEEFNNLLNYAYKKGYIRGINSTITALPSAQDDNGTNRSIGCYLEQYQTPETPYVVSELRGTNVYKLFKFILISDGNAANQEVKISILNISFNNGTFDVCIRAYNDTDASPVYLEKFTNCSLNPSSNSYVGV
jgi:hypothetical protein